MKSQRKQPTYKQHRLAAERYAKSDQYHWHRRFIKEMKQKQTIIQKVVKGLLDYALNSKK